MNKVHQLVDLEVIGFANELLPSLVPAILPPVFRYVSDRDRVLVPPFSLSGGYVVEPAEISTLELTRYVDSREITLLESPFLAKPNHELWADTELRLHYEPRTQSRASLAAIDRESLAKAKSAFHRAEFENAEKLAGIAFCANERSWEALVVKAAIFRMRGEHADVDVMTELAQRLISRDEFLQRVNELAPEIRRAGISGQASRKPRFEYAEAA